jgi:hypothetical protein
VTVLTLGLVAAVAAGGCRLPENALDGPLAVPLRISATAEAIEVDAPTWYAARTALFLCTSEPPSLPEPGPDRVGWTPNGSCHDFGRVAADGGLHVTQPLDVLTETDRRALEGADEWYLLLVKIEGDRATAATHSRFASPIRPAN